MVKNTNNFQPLVSVIMPAYNSAQTIGTAINSVLMQDYLNWEIIIIDDGSTDDTLNEIRKFKDARIKVFSQDNQGPSVSRNYGIKIANGEYIAFLDADDFWEKDKLNLQLQMLCNSEERMGLVHSNYYEFDHKRSYLPKPFRYTKMLNLEGNVYESLVIHNFVATLTVIVKREVFDNIGYFDTSLKAPEDWDLWIRIAKKYTFGYIPTPLARYRLNPSGISKNYYAFEKELQKVINRYLIAENHPQTSQKFGLWLFYRHMAHGYARHGDFCRSFDRLSKAFRMKPLERLNILSITYIILQLLLMPAKSILRRHQNETKSN